MGKPNKVQADIRGWEACILLDFFVYDIEHEAFEA